VSLVVDKARGNMDNCAGIYDALVFLDAVPENEMRDTGLRRKIRDFAIAAAVNGEDSAAISGRLDSRYEWLEIVRRRDTCAQLQAIADAAYRAGVKRLEREIADSSAPQSRKDHLCLVTIRGEASRSLGTMDGLAAT
jgi:hypothetical protein